MNWKEKIQLQSKLLVGYRNRTHYDNPRINHHYQFVFVHIPKTAGNSITQQLVQMRAGHGNALSPKVSKHAKAQQIKALIGATKWEDYFTFTFVRNPWDLMVSSYHWWCQKAPNLGKNHRRRAKTVQQLGSFEAFLRSPIGSNRINERYGCIKDWIVDEQGKQMVDYIGKLETLQEDWKQICTQANCPYTPLAHLNKTKRAHYSSYYTAATKALIQQRFQYTIERFGYVFEG